MPTFMTFHNFVPEPLAFLIEGLEEYFQPVDHETHEVIREGDDFYIIERGCSLTNKAC